MPMISTVAKVMPYYRLPEGIVKFGEQLLHGRVSVGNTLPSGTAVVAFVKPMSREPDRVVERTQVKRIDVAVCYCDEDGNGDRRQYAGFDEYVGFTDYFNHSTTISCSSSKRMPEI